MRIQRILSVLLLLVTVTALCGFAFAGSNIAADTETYHVYKYVTADDLLTLYSANRANAKSRYADQYLLISGRFENSTKDSFNIMNSSNVSLRCDIPKNTYIDLSQYRFNESIVAVYGKCTFVPISDEIRIVAERVILQPRVISSDTYFTIDGSSFDRSAASEQTLADGRVRYYIPPAWHKIETRINTGGEDSLGNIDGYQYQLNLLPGGSAEPESLFVCYFDKKHLSNVDQIRLTNKVEKAIIDNISGHSSSFNFSRRNTYYGRKYDRYFGKYNDELDAGKGYRVEYIFEPDGDRGMVMYLYLYRETRHLSDVMFTMRFLEK